MPADGPAAAWSIVVPVKRLAEAKTRLAPLGDDVRRQLALAFAQDVVLAVLTCAPVRAVLVVTDDPVVGAALAALGAVVVPEPADQGLNPALVHGAALMSGARRGVAALVADLPALRSDELAAVLGQVGAGESAFVPDLAGAGTTLLAAGPERVLAPSYGPQSRRQHRAAGALELPAPDGLRLDVDTPADLAAAERLGVGPFTAEVLATLARR